jgi:predicted ATPase
MNKLSTLTFKGYKSFYDETKLELGNLNVLIGANQSGKSNVLDLFELLRQASERNLQTAIRERGGIDNVLSWDSEKELSIRLMLDGETDNLKGIDYDVSIVNEFHKAIVRAERFEGIDMRSEGKKRYLFSPTETELYLPVIEFGELGLEANNRERYSSFKSFFKSITVHCYFDTTQKAPMRDADFIGTQISGLPATRLSANGDNLTSVLYLISHDPKYRETLEEYEFTLRQAFPTFRHLTFPPISQGKTIVSWADTRTARAISATFLSDGTLRLMCLLAALYDPNPPALLCIDEPEVGLHPDMLRLLAAVIQKASERMQIIISTHSTDLLSFLDAPDKVIICESENGRSKLVHKTKEELARWLEVYSLGELWKSGEIGGRP